MQTTFRRKALAAIFAVFSSVLLMSGSAFAQAQATSGQIAGTVVDQTGAVVANATITATNPATGFKQTTTSNGDGEYRLVQLPPGEYNVTAEAGSFQPTTFEKITVLVGRIFDLKITLGVSGSSDVVEVTAGGVQVSRSEADNIQNAAAIQNLPINGRRFQDFVTLSPAAQVEGRRGQISLSGQKGIYGANVNVDGVDYNQPFFGGIRGGERSNTAFTIPQESIREFQVVSAGYSPEFGRSTGGLVNAVTKSGTNQFHGSAFYLIRPSEASRTNDFFRAVEANILSSTGVARAVKPAPTQQQFGGSIGGPIVKDKFFFFFAYEQQRFRNNREVFFDNLVNVTPITRQAEAFNFFNGLRQRFDQTNDAFAPFVRLDWTINSRNSLAVRYNFGFNRALNANATGNQILPTTQSALSNNGAERNRNNIGVVQFNTTLTPTLINEFRYQFAREDRPRSSNSSLPTATTFVGNFGAVGFLPTTQFDTRNQFIDNITWLKGDHSFKFGVDYSRLFVNQLFGFNQFGAYTFVGVNTAAGVLDNLSSTNFISNTTTGLTNFGRFDQTTARYNRQIGNRLGEYTVNQLAFFAQDSWKIRPNLTINYGLRWDGQFNPDPDATNTALVNGVSNFQYPIDVPGFRRNPATIPDDTEQFAPRFGVAWDPFNNGKSVFRANVGYFYATTPLLLLAASQNNFRATPGDVSVQLPFSVPSPFLTNASSGAPVNPAYLPFANAFNANAGTAAYRAFFGNLPTNPTNNQAVQNILPNSVYRQFFLGGVNLNNSPLGNLPNVTPDQINSIAALLGASTASTLQPTFTAGDFRNPRSIQFGFGYEYQVLKGFTVGIDFNQITTSFLQRNRDLNLPFPVVGRNPVAGDISLRPIFGITAGTARPNTNVGQLTVRESTARSRFRSMVIRAKVERKWGQFNAFYTLSDNFSSDDQERDAGGFTYTDSFNLASEYNFSELDRRHQFVMQPLFYMPYGFEVASTIRLQSAPPINALVGSDVNQDNVNNDRPYSAPGVAYKRNAFRNRPFYNFDLRVQKGFRITESQRLVLSVEFFNLFNAMNLSLSGAAVTNLCDFTGLSGTTLTAAQRNCGLAGSITNPNFLSLRDNRAFLPGTTTPNPRAGQLLLNNNSGSVFQMQFGVRYQF